MVEVNAPEISGLSDFFSFVASITNDYFVLAVILATFIITYLTVFQSTKNERDGMLAGSFMGFFTAVTWFLSIGSPVAMVAAVAFLIIIVLVGRSP